LAATALLMAGKHEDLERMALTLGDQMTSPVRESVAWSHIEQGNALLAPAKTKAGEEADALFRQAYEKYAQALVIKAHMHEALYNWGTVLLDQAMSKAGEEADKLFEQSRPKPQRLTGNELSDFSWLWHSGCVKQSRRHNMGPKSLDRSMSARGSVMQATLPIPSGR
jgi:hypothetical protein